MMRLDVNRRSGLRWALAASVLFLVLAGKLDGATVTLAWDPNTEPDIAGYKLYYGSPVGNFSQVVNVGNITNTTVSTLLEGSTYAFYVTCYNTSGLESEPSNVVEYTVPTGGGGNHVPLAISQTVNAVSEAEVVITLAGADTDGDPLSFNIASFPVSGDLTGYAAGNGNTATIRYRSTAGFAGVDAFTFNVNDGYEVSADATVSIHVSASGDPAADHRTWLVEAESGVATGPLVVISDPTASGGACVATSTSEQGSVSYDFAVPVEADYVVWCRIRSTSGGADSFYVMVDDDPSTRDIFDTAAQGYSEEWQWTPLCGRGGASNPVELAYSVSPRVFHFTPGTHRLTVQGRERNTGLDGLIITADATYVPAASGGSAQAPMLSGGGVTSAGGGVVLEWVAIPGRRYQLAYKEQLTAGAWTLLPGVYQPSSALGTGVDSTAGATQRFYSVVLLP